MTFYEKTQESNIFYTCTSVEHGITIMSIVMHGIGNPLIKGIKALLHELDDSPPAFKMTHQGTLLIYRLDNPRDKLIVVACRRVLHS
jgi:hypothetical protein